MNLRLSGLLLGAVVGSACQGQEGTPLPGSGASFLLVIGAGSETRIWASAGTPPAFSLSDSDLASLLMYDEPLDHFFLEPGEQSARARDSAGTRLLPPTPTAYRLLPGPDPSWQPLALPAPDLPALDAISAVDCIEGGGCYPSPEDRSIGNCKRPCAVTAVAVPSAAPRPPEPPHFRPCPSGWLEQDAEGLALCRPPERVASCPDDEIQLLGSDRCEPISPPCPAGFPSWGADGRPRAYVDDDAPAGGDGSEGNPFDTLAEGLSAAGPNGVLLLAPGRYSHASGTLRAFALVGACAEATRLLLPAGSVPLQIDGPLTIQDLLLDSEGPSELVDVLATGQLELLRVALGSAAHQPGIGVRSLGRVSGSRLRLRPTVRAFALHGGQLELDQVSMESSTGGGVERVEGPATIQLTDFFIATASTTAGLHNGGPGSTRLSNGWIEGGFWGLVLGPDSALDGVYVHGAKTAVQIEDGGGLSATRLLIEDTERGFLPIGFGGRFTLSDSAVLHADKGDDSNDGISLAGASVVLERVWVEHVRGDGIRLAATASVSDLTIRDVRGRNQTDGLGLSLLSSAVAVGGISSLRRVAVFNTGLGIKLNSAVMGMTQSYLLEDIAIHADADFGTDHGLHSSRIGELHLLRARVEGHNEGMRLEPADRSITLEDVSSSGYRVAGLQFAAAQSGLTGHGQASIDRIELGPGPNAGLAIRSDWTLSVHDLSIHDVSSIGGPSNGVIVETATLELERFSIARVAGRALRSQRAPILRIAGGSIEDCDAVVSGATLDDVLVGVRISGNRTLSE